MKMCKRTICLLLAIILILLTGCAPNTEVTGEIEQIGMESSVKALQSDAKTFETVISLTGLTWKDDVSAGQIQFSGALSGMKITSITRIDDVQLKLAAEGSLDGMERSIIAFSKDAVNESETPPQEQEGELTAEEQANKELHTQQEQNAFPYSVAIDILHPSAEAIIENTGGKDAVVTIILTDDAFADNLTPELFTVVSADKTVDITDVKKPDNSTCTLTLAGNADEVFAALGNAAIHVAADAMISGRQLEVVLDVYDANISATVDYVEEADDGFLATIFLDLSNGTLADFKETDLTVGGELAKLTSFVKENDNHVTIQSLVKQEGAELDSLSFDGTLSISGKWGTTRWGAPRADIMLDVHYDVGDTGKELLAMETNLVYDLLKTGIKSLASGIGSKVGGRLAEVIDSDLFGDKIQRQLGELNTYLKQMDSKWSSALDRLNSHVSIVEEKIGQNNCSRVLDSYDTLADKLRATVLHLANKKDAVDKAKKGTPEYDAAAAAYVAAVNRENCKVYSDAYVLGQKLLQGSAGLSTGVVGTFDEMLSLIYNFDVQTFDLKEEFRVLTLSLYLEAYDHAVLYYELTEPNNRLLSELKNQMVAVSKILDKMDVVRRSDDNAYCYAAKTTVKRFAGAAIIAYVHEDKNAINGTAAELMLKRAKYRNTTLGADLDSSGFYSVNVKDSFTGAYNILVVDASKSHKYESSKRQWWTYATKVNVETHDVDKNALIHYQRQEWSLFNGWQTKECWNSYVSIGLILEPSAQ
ncbi:MAG: hypothetical protein GX939_07440 [Clostridiaceae bacterium]|jgi:hypothetical protein|nr:hypothetical protein [Clostridiaceae bacterium]